MMEHVDRLYRSLKYVRIDPGLTSQEMLDLSEEGIERNRHLLDEVGDFSISQLVTRGPGGPSRMGGRPSECLHQVRTQYHLVRRQLRERPSRSHHADAELRRGGARPEAQASQPHEHEHSRARGQRCRSRRVADLTDKDGYLTEGSGYNVFIVTDGVLRTPTERAILAGVSRGMVLDLADGLGLPATVEHLQPYDAYTADEAFFTSTPFCVLPVTYIDKRPMGDGKPGPITMQLLAAWSEAVGIDVIDQAMQLSGGTEGDSAVL